MSTMTCLFREKEGTMPMMAKVSAPLSSKFLLDPRMNIESTIAHVLLKGCLVVER